MFLNPITEKEFQWARSALSRFVMRRAAYTQVATNVRWLGVGDDPGYSFEQLLADYRSGCIRIWTGASDRAIYTSPYVNCAFRYWHDSLHCMYEKDMSWAGELFVAGLHCAAVGAVFGCSSLEHKLMHSDTFGQLDYFQKTGGFVEDQLAWTREQLGVKP